MKKFILLLAITQLGCFLPKKLLPEDFSLNMIEIPLFIEEVSVVDKRKNMKSMDWDVKTMTLKNQTYEGNPELSTEQIATIEEIFKKASTPDATPAKVTFYLETGYCLMKHHYSEQSSFTKIRGEVLIDVYPRASKYKGFAELQYTYNHPYVTKDHILQMYLINLKNVAFNNLEAIKKELEDIK